MICASSVTRLARGTDPRAIAAAAAAASADVYAAAERVRQEAISSTANGRDAMSDGGAGPTALLDRAAAAGATPEGTAAAAAAAALVASRAAVGVGVRFKCPTCPTEMNAGETLILHF